MHVESGIAADDPERQNKNNVQQLRKLVEMLAEPEITHQENALAGSNTTIITKRRPDNDTVIYYIWTNNGRSANESLAHNYPSVEIIGQDTSGDIIPYAKFSVLGSDRIRRVLSDQTRQTPQTERFLTEKEAKALLDYVTPPFDPTDEEQERNRDLIMGLSPEEQESVERFKDQAYTVGAIAVGNMHG